jgi:hypothetical protein
MQRKADLSIADLTANDLNCYVVQAANMKLCNLGDFIRVNLPAGQHHYNFMQISLRGDRVTNEFHCCPTRKVIDSRLDVDRDEFARLFNKDFSRDVRCLIHSMLTCEDCGGKCDACPAQCPNVCPNGNCHAKPINW